LADEKVEEVEKKSSNFIGRGIIFLSPITEKVRDIVLGFGELIVTVSVIVGVVAAVIGGVSDMGNIGFFAGLSSIFTEIVGVIMAALVIFLLFAIYRNGEKPIKKK